MAKASTDDPSFVAAAGGCTALRLRKVTRGVSRIYDSFIAPSGLSGPQFSLLANIASTSSITIGELADRLMMDATTLTRNLQPLQRQGLVQVTPQKSDRRVREIRVTSAGMKSLATARKLWRQAQEFTTRQLGADDVAVLNAALDRALAKLETLEKSDVPTGKSG